VGLAVGVVRMTLDFVYKEPLCGEVDTRPRILHLHYMYFAMLLFGLTGLIMIFVSLLTKPPTDKQVRDLNIHVNNLCILCHLMIENS
jgi:hypothetical protein